MNRNRNPVPLSSQGPTEKTHPARHRAPRPAPKEEADGDGAHRHPADWLAFRTLYRHTYLRYARARGCTQRESVLAVEAVFSALADTWPQILSSPSPERVAWRTLGRALGHAVGTDRQRTAERPRPGATRDQEEAQILCHVMALSVREAAALTGRSEASVHSALRAAARGLGAHRE
ncbi:hypothetical protein ACFXOR_11365 [Streptomyces sp. NPDC059164]|uniref:hypothetical protein n=1 Tax=Streptomyces sp. NPDC059164 TaxID=3346750 RepID=UPI00369BA099